MDLVLHERLCKRVKSLHRVTGGHIILVFVHFIRGDEYIFDIPIDENDLQKVVWFEKSQQLYAHKRGV